MRILHVVEDFSIEAGGLRAAVRDLNHYLSLRQVESYVLSTDKEEEDTIYQVQTKGKWRYSAHWQSTLNRIVTEKRINLIHIHGIWLYPQYATAKYAVKHKIPFVLSAHGMLQPWLWRKGTLKKRCYFSLMIKKWFTKAHSIHAITSDEKRNLKGYFPSNKFVEIPNLIAVKKDTGLSKPENYILYLGRLNKTKGIDLLIKAFKNLETTHFKLKIAGSPNHYKKELEALISKLKLSEQVAFVGTVKRQEKERLIKNAWVMVSPTYSDVIGIVNLEAASLRTPMITTYNTGLSSDWGRQGGKLINPTLNELEAALREALDWTSEIRDENGNKLYNFVKSQYSWDSRISDWIHLYNSALNEDKI